MRKDFDGWNRLKKILDGRDRYPFASPREVWWCALGLNVGVEINGKHEQFERPVIVIRAYNTEMLKIVPLTTRAKEGRFYLKISSATGESYAVLSQTRVISARRLLRKVGKISPSELKSLKERVRALEI